MFRIIEVPEESADLPEQLGTKFKFWFRNSSGHKCLFKQGRPNTGENWAEKVAAELCLLLGLPAASYELGKFRDKRGVISPTFVPPNGRLILGNELLAKKTLSTVDAFLEGARFRPAAARAWVNRLKIIPFDHITNIFADFPHGEISQIAADFSLQMVKLNKARLLSSIENL